MKRESSCKQHEFGAAATEAAHATRSETRTPAGHIKIYPAESILVSLNCYLGTVGTALGTSDVSSLCTNYS